MNDLLTQQAIRNRGRSFLEPGIVFLIAYIFYLITQTENFSAAHDSITYLVGITQGENLYHPHHLLYHISAYKWLLFWQAMLPGTADHALIQAFTSLWGAGLLALVFHIFRSRFLMNIITAISGTTIIGFSYGVWFYSTNIEVYLPSVFFILLLLHLIPEKLNTKNIFPIAVLHSIAILFHQVNILFSIIIIFLIIRDRHNIRITKGILIYFFTGLFLVGGFYFYGGWIAEGHNDFESWITWIRGYTYGHNYWRPWNENTPISVITGASHAFIGGHFLFQLPLVSNYLVDSLNTHSLTDELFLSSAIDPVIAWFLTGLSIAILILIFFLIARLVKYKSWKITGRHHAYIKLSVFTILLYSLFFSFWMPEILEFWILQMVLFWIILIGSSSHKGITEGRPGNPAILITLSICMFFVNYFGSMRWLADKKYDSYNIQTEALITHLSPGDIVILEDPWILDGYIRYLTGNRVFGVKDIVKNPQTIADQRIFYIQKNAAEGENDLSKLLNRKLSDDVLYLPGGLAVYILE